MAHSIGVLKCNTDIFFITAWPSRKKEISHMDRKFWPDTKAFLDRSPMCAANVEMETAR